MAIKKREILTPFEKRTGKRDPVKEKLFQQAQLKKNRQEAASQFDTFLRNNPLPTVQEYEKFFNKIPPPVQKFMRISLKDIKKQQQTSVQKIEKRIQARKQAIERSREDARRYSREDRDKRADRENARQDGYRVEIRELQKFLPRLKKGEILDAKKVISFADDLGDAERREERAKLANRRAKEKALKATGLLAEKGKVKRSTIRVVNKQGQVETVPIFVDDKGKVSATTIKDANLLKDYNKATGSKNIADLQKLSDEIKKDVSSQKARARIVKEAVKSNARARELFNKGFSPQEVTSILAAREGSKESLQALENQNLNYDKFFKKLESKKVGVDRASLSNAFKVAVNQEISKANRSTIRSNLKKVPYTANVEKFKEQYNKLIKNRQAEVERFNKFVQQTQKKDLLSFYNSAQNKALTGQSLTPKDFKRLQTFYKNQNQKRRNKINGFFGSPITYGNNLLERIKSGEKNALANDLKKFGTFSKGVGIGALKETGDLINFFLGVKGLTINSKGVSRDGLIAKPTRALLEYGINLYKATKKNQGVEKVKSDISTAVQNTKEFGKGTVDVAKFIYKNPVLTTVLVGAAIESGVVKGKSSFLKNPSENTGRALVWLFPGTIVKGVKGSGKVLTKSAVTAGLTGIQRTRAIALTNRVKDLEDKLDLEQSSRLTKAIRRYSKIGSKKERESKLKTFLVRLARESGVKLSTKQVRNSDVKDIVDAIKTKGKSIKVVESKKLKGKPTGTKKPRKKPTKKPQDEKVLVFNLKDGTKSNILKKDLKKKKKSESITLVDFSGKPIKKRTVNPELAVRKFLRDELKKKGIKISPSEFNRLKLEDLQDIAKFAQRNKFSTPKTRSLIDTRLGKIKKVDVKKKKTTKITPRKSTTRVKKIDLTKANKKTILRNTTVSIKGNKKAQAQLRNVFSDELSDLKSKYNNLKKQYNNAKKRKDKKQVKKKLTELQKLKKKIDNFFDNITFLNNNKLLKVTALLKGIRSLRNTANKDLPRIANEVANLISPKKKIGKKSGTKPATGSATKLRSPVRTKPKLIGKPKTPKKPRKPRTPKKVPKKPRRLKINSKNLPKKGSRAAYQIKLIKGNKILFQSKNILPLKRAANAARERIKRNKNTVDTYRLTQKGKTKIIDVKNTKFDESFKGNIKEAKLRNK